MNLMPDSGGFPTVQKRAAVEARQNFRCIALAMPGNFGDVVACLPAAGVLRSLFPRARIVFIASRYAWPLLACSGHVDTLLDCEEVKRDPAVLAAEGADAFINFWLCRRLGAAARQAGIPLRVGNLRRPKCYGWANRFIFQGQRSSPLHTAQINLRYLEAVGIAADFPVNRLHEWIDLTRVPPLQPSLAAALATDRFNLVFHAKTNKNGREWPASYYLRLAELLPSSDFRIFLTGREHEREEIAAECPELLTSPRVIDMIGRVEADQLLPFLKSVDGVVAAGTGPLHLAAALGRYTLGLFPGRLGINAQRWQPLGARAEVLQQRSDCEPWADRCPRRSDCRSCACMLELTPEAAAARIRRWIDPVARIAVTTATVAGQAVFNAAQAALILG